MTVKTSLHAQGWDPWLNEYLQVSGANWIKFVNWFPVMPLGIGVIGRVRAMSEYESNVLVGKGEQGAVEYAQAVFPEQDKNRHVDLWEGPNETSIWLDWVLAGYHDFYQRLIQLYHAEGFPIMAGQFNTGWPFLPTDDGGRQSEIVGRAIQGADAVSFHEYDPVALWAKPGYNALRYRKTVAYWRSLGLQVPDVFITELGLDDNTGGPSFGHSGWKTILQADLQAYIDQLAWYESEIQRDDYVVAATVFSVVTNWEDFELDREQSLALGRALAEVEPPPPIERAQGLDLNMFSGDVNFDALREAGYRWVGIRFSGPNADRTDVIVDPRAHAYYEGAGTAGLLRLGYHGLMPGFDGQAGLYIGAVGGRRLEMGHYSDLENRALTDDKCRVHLEAMDRRIAEAYGLEPGKYANVYTSPGFMSGRDGSWGVGRDLWLAHWTYDLALEPKVPEPWASSGYQLWQWSNLGTDVPGTEKRVCLDVYAGTVDELYEEYGDPGNGGNGGDMDIIVRDESGALKDWDWVVLEFGPLDVRLAEPVQMADGSKQVVRLVEVREQFAAANCNVHLLDINGAPVSGINAAWWYSTAPGLPDIEPPTSEWEPRGDYGPTNSEGVVGFAMSDDGKYYPDRGEIGPYGTWILAPGHPSDGFFGIGMEQGTDHRHLNCWFQVVKVEEPTPPLPTGGWRIRGSVSVDLVIEPVGEE